MLLECFKKRGEKIYNERLLYEWKSQQEYRKKRSEAGKMGMKSRYQKDNRVITPLQHDYNLESSESISISDTVSDKEEKGAGKGNPNPKTEESPSGEKEREAVRALIAQWLNTTFARPVGQTWTCEEQHLLVEVAGRQDAMDEITTIQRYWTAATQADEKVPKSVGRVLAAWSDLLDRARVAAKPAVATDDGMRGLRPDTEEDIRNEQLFRRSRKMA